MSNFPVCSESFLRRRKNLFDSIRTFFDSRGFLEVDTPIRIQAPALEDYIDAEPSGDFYLRTSPELHMKRLLAAGLTKIYQIGPCFRKGELGRRHLPEFTMLEWYRTGADCKDILEDTRELVRHCACEVCGETNLRVQGREIVLDDEWENMSVDEAFGKYSREDVSVDELLESGRFESVLVNDIQPDLGHKVPTILRDFPAGMSSLAKQCADNPLRVERWELFIAGMELANAYTELTDYEDQVRRFEASSSLRSAAGREIYPVDREYLRILADKELPECGGIAFGVDRFLMLLAGCESIHEAVPFADDRPAESSNNR